MQGPAVGATATVTREPIVATATGSVTVSTVYPQATLSFDAGSIQPWLAQDRQTRVEVLLDGVVQHGLTGSLEWTESESSPIKDASLQIVDERGTYMHPSSFLYGGQLVEIYVTTRTARGRSRKLMFRGNVEAASNDGTYTPRAALRASSQSRAWGDRGANMGSLSIPAMSGLSWGEAIVLYAASTCTPLTSFANEFTDEIYTSLDISGLSLVDLIQRWAPMIGGYLRETEDTLELVPERFVVGPLASPAWDFLPSNYHSVREDLPSRPVTSLTVSAVIPDMTALQNAEGSLPETTISIVRSVDENGVTTETTTTTSWRIRTAYVRSGLDYYASRLIVEDTFADTDPYGVVTDFGWRRIRRVTTEDLYQATPMTVYIERGLLAPEAVTRYVPTEQLLRTLQTVEAWYAPLASTVWTYGGSQYVYPDGSHHTIATPSLQQIEDSVTDYYYRASAELGGGVCKLEKKLMIRSGYGSRLEPTGNQWDDGTYRVGVAAGDAESYGTLERQTEVWVDNGDDLARSTPYSTGHTLEHRAWKQTGSELVSSEVRPREAFVIDHLEGEIRVARGPNRYDELTMNDGVTKTNPVEGQIPDVPTASPTTAAIAESVIVVTGSSLRNIYPLTRQSESIQDAQRDSEVYRYIRRKLRDALAVRYVISHPMVPELQTFDSGRATNAPRFLNLERCYISAIRRFVDLSTGRLGQETTVAVTPPELDPVWP